MQVIDACERHLRLLSVVRSMYCSWIFKILHQEVETNCSSVGYLRHITQVRYLSITSRFPMGTMARLLWARSLCPDGLKSLVADSPSQKEDLLSVFHEYIYGSTS